MNNSTYRFTLDLRQHQSQMSINVFRYDTAVRLCISLTDGGKPYEIGEGCIATFFGKRADGVPLVHECMFNDTFTEIIYDFEETTAPVVGIVDCHIRLCGVDGKLISAPKFTIVVDELIVNDEDIEIDGESPISALDRLLALTAKITGAHFRYSENADGTDFTETWSPGQNYIGIASKAEAPTEKEEYTWCRFVGEAGAGGAINADEVINKILDPDNYPLKENTNAESKTITLEYGKISTTDGTEKDGDGLRTPDFIDVSSYDTVAPIFKLGNADKFRLLFYDSSQNFLAHRSFLTDETCKMSDYGEVAYIKGYASFDDTNINPGSGEVTFKLSDGDGKGTKAEHKKIYIADHGYAIYGDEIDDETMHKLVLEALGKDSNSYNITEIKAPKGNAKEATLALMNSGKAIVDGVEHDVNQFVDFSSMVYDPEHPEVVVVCQTRGGKPLPIYAIAYNDGNKYGDVRRVRKFTVHPDAIPIELTSEGIKVRKNNNRDEGTEDDFVVVNLAELAAGGGGGVQANYAANDTNDPSYIKNRPFYELDGGVAGDEITEGGLNDSWPRDPDGYIVGFSDRIVPRDELFADGAEYNVEFDVGLESKREIIKLKPEFITILQEDDSGLVVAVKGSITTYNLYFVYDYTSFSVSTYNGEWQAQNNGIYYYDESNYRRFTLIRVFREQIDAVVTLPNKFLDLKGNSDFQEVESIAKGANDAISYNSYQEMVYALNEMDDKTYRVGQNIMIVTLNVPDLWISRISSNSDKYIPPSEGYDEGIVNALSTTGSIQVGYYVLSALETQKVNLTDYVKNTDYATSTKAGVIRSAKPYGFLVGNGAPAADVLRAEEYPSKSSSCFIGKGTLESIKSIYVKQGITENTTQLTDEEKTSAKAWLGIDYDMRISALEEEIKRLKALVQGSTS